MPRVLDKQRSVASIPEISLISVVENGEKFAYGKCSTQLYYFFFLVLLTNTITTVTGTGAGNATWLRLRPLGLLLLAPFQCCYCYY